MLICVYDIGGLYDYPTERAAVVAELGLTLPTGDHVLARKIEDRCTVI